MKQAKIFVTVAFLVTLVIPSSYALAAEEVTVRAGQKTQVYQYTVFFPDLSCKHTIYPKVRDQNTKHGKITSSPGSFIAPSGRCKGKRMKATNIYYTPNPGFRGKDSARIAITHQKFENEGFGNKSKIMRFKFTVK